MRYSFTKSVVIKSKNGVLLMGELYMDTMSI
jgi:hypothetical protein